MINYKNKNVLVTGGTGMIGRELVKLLLSMKANVRVVSLDSPEGLPENTQFIHADLTDYNQCLNVCDGMDSVFSLIGIKGSPLMCQKRPATFMDPTVLFSFNMLRAAKKCGVKRYLFTSSVGVYSPSEIFNEDDVWKTMPSENDWYSGWAKRIGELQVSAYKKEFGWNEIAIVRPANVYGLYDNFSHEDAMVIPSLVRRAVNGDNPFVVWGDGTSIRDFIHARDVARGMLIVMDKMPEYPVNLGSGKGVAIKDIVEIINSYMNNSLNIVYDTSRPFGDKKRLMNTQRAESLGFIPEIPLNEGISEVIEWYRNNKDVVDKRYNVFFDGK